MTTKDYLLSNIIPKGYNWDNLNHGPQNNNLSLNQNHKCNIMQDIQSKSNSSMINKSFVWTAAFKTILDKANDKSCYLSLKKDYPWSKPDTGLFGNLGASKFQEYGNLFDDNQCSKFPYLNASLNKSTLSLTIASYESSIIVGGSDAQNNDGKAAGQSSKKKQTGKTWKNVKSFMGWKDSDATIFGAIEIPRQQENQTTEPEIMQFKASQKLINPNASKSSSDSSNSRNSTDPSSNSSSTTSLTSNSAIIQSLALSSSYSGTLSDYSWASSIESGPYLRFDPTTAMTQNFCIPEKICYYMANFPLSAKAYEKLIQSCKYFFKINPITLIASANYDTVTSETSSWAFMTTGSDEYKRVQLEDFQKLWITDSLIIQNIFLKGLCSEIINHIYRSDISVLNLHHQEIKLNEFMMLTRHVKSIVLNDNEIIDDNQKVLSIECLIKNLPKLQTLSYTINNEQTDFTCNSTAALIASEKFKQLKKISFNKMNEIFDFELFKNFMIENNMIEFRLNFTGISSEVYAKKLSDFQSAIDKYFPAPCPRPSLWFSYNVNPVELEQ